MPTFLRYLLLLGALPLATSCQTDADVRPASYDALALATGHWEWESSAYQGGLQTPASLGFTRQVVFGPTGQLTVHRRGQADYRTTYQLSMGVPQPCGAAPVPLVTYTSEPDLANTDAKLYTLTQRASQQVLIIAGEALCLDGGAVETYRWVQE
jgi:hypothetical protein